MPMRAHTRSLVIVAALTVACGREVPGAGPTPVPSPGPSTQTYSVSGTVTNEDGAPVPNAEVTLAHSRNGFFYRPSVRTDASGHFAIAFSPTVLPGLPGVSPSFVARAEIVADGYDWFWRNFYAGSAERVEDVRLIRTRYIRPGEELRLTVSRANGDCIADFYDPCGRLRVVAPSAGRLTIEAIPVGGGAMPRIEACCANGNEVYGNPASIAVAAGSETWVEIGQTGATVDAAPVVLVRASWAP